MSPRKQRVWAYGASRPRPIRQAMEPEITIEVRWRSGGFTLHGSPWDLDAFAIGYLVSEGVVRSFRDIRSIRVGPVRGDRVRVDVDLRRPSSSSGTRRDNVVWGPHTRVARRTRSAETAVRAKDLHALAVTLARSEKTMRAAGHLHWGAVYDPSDRSLLMASDISRHSALDRAIGKALLAGHSAEGCVLYSTGRIGEEMAAKAIRSRAAALATRSVAFAPAVGLASRNHLVLVGKLRPDGFWVYAGRDRLRPIHRRTTG